MWGGNEVKPQIVPVNIADTSELLKAVRVLVERAKNGQTRAVQRETDGMYPVFLPYEGEREKSDVSFLQERLELLGTDSVRENGRTRSWCQHVDLLMRTSGSTGREKVVMLSAASLGAAVQLVHAALGGPGQWLCALPKYRISGFMPLVRSLAAGYAPVLYPHAKSFDPAVFSECAQSMDAPRRYVSLVLPQLRVLLERARTDSSFLQMLQRFDGIVVGGGPADTALMQEASDAGLQIAVSYGATETCGGIVYDGVALRGVRVRIREGQVQIASPTLACGYLLANDVENDPFLWENGSRWYQTGDIGKLFGGVLHLLGRKDRVFISGGVNVSLDEIERVMRQRWARQQHVAVAVADPKWGQRAVVFTTVPENQLRQIAPLLTETLGKAARPTAIVRCDTMLVLPTSAQQESAFCASLASAEAVCANEDGVTVLRCSPLPDVPTTASAAAHKPNYPLLARLAKDLPL